MKLREFSNLRLRSIVIDTKDYKAIILSLSKVVDMFSLDEKHSVGENIWS
jgi:hypothetical protein